ncbi:MAG TPA: ATP-grasp domain-containing protein [Acetobacteraceae bacterium]|jgi:hypothetical protein
MIRFTGHAERELRRRAIAHEWVETTIATPARTEPDPRDPTLTRSFKAIAAFGNRMPRVVHRRDHDDMLVNEIAPRPHNSGHWTIDACPASQFELHIRAIAGLPLLPAVRHSDAVMKNLAGPEDLALWPAILGTPGLIPHLYGKTDARPGRKMGHVTRLFPLGGLPGEFGVRAALGMAAPRDEP